MEIMELISNVGFPIACCAAMYGYIMNQSKQHKEEVDSLRDVLNNNTLILTELKDAIHMLIGGKRGDSENKQ